MSLSQADTEMQCVVHWFNGWSPMQKGDFLKDLAEKAVPNMDTLFDAMGVLVMDDKPPSIFKCQIKLFDQWFGGWTDSERGNFLMILRQTDPAFMNKFDEMTNNPRT